MFLLQNRTSAGSISKILLRFTGLCVCVIFAFTDFRVAFLSFGGNGISGFLFGFMNLIVVHTAFMAVYYVCLTGSLPRRLSVCTLTLLLSGSLFSVNFAYAATIYKMDFAPNTIPAFNFLYLLPVLTLVPILFALYKKESMEVPIKEIFARNRLLILAFFYETLFFLLPIDIYSVSFTNVNTFLLLALFILQLRQNHTAFSEIFGKRLKVDITLTLRHG